MQIRKSGEVVINRRKYATVSFTEEDVAALDVCPIQWDIQRCHDALKYVEKDLKERVREFGLDMLGDLLEEFIKEDEKRWAVRSGPCEAGLVDYKVRFYLYWQDFVGDSPGMWISDKGKATLYNISEKSAWSLPPDSEWQEMDVEFDIVDSSDNMPGDDE